MDAVLTLVEKTALLKAFPVFAAVPTEALAQLATRSRELHIEAGEVVFREGDTNRGSFIVVEGTLTVKKGGVVLRVVPAGMGIGEMALGAGDKHTLTLEALEHTHAINFTPDDVMDAVMDFPEVGLGLIRLLGQRLAEVNDRTLDLERVIQRLHDTLRAAGLDPPEGAESPPPTGTLPGFSANSDEPR